MLQPIDDKLQHRLFTNYSGIYLTALVDATRFLAWTN